MSLSSKPSSFCAQASSLVPGWLSSKHVTEPINLLQHLLVKFFSGFQFPFLFWPLGFTLLSSELCNVLEDTCSIPSIIYRCFCSKRVFWSSSLLLFKKPRSLRISFYHQRISKTPNTLTFYHHHHQHHLIIIFFTTTANI